VPIITLVCIWKELRLAVHYSINISRFLLYASSFAIYMVHQNIILIWNPFYYSFWSTQFTGRAFHFSLRNLFRYQTGDLKAFFIGVAYCHFAADLECEQEIWNPEGFMGRAELCVSTIYICHAAPLGSSQL